MQELPTMDPKATSSPVVARGAATAERSSVAERGGTGQRKPPTDPDAAVEQILALLSEDRYRSARELAMEARRCFPEHTRVRDTWAIFDNRGKATAGPKASEPKRTAEFEWLREPPESVRGKWVALVGSELVGVADVLSELAEALRSRTFSRRPLIHYVD